MMIVRTIIRFGQKNLPITRPARRQYAEIDRFGLSIALASEATDQRSENPMV